MYGYTYTTSMYIYVHTRVLHCSGYAAIMCTLLCNTLQYYHMTLRDRQTQEVHMVQSLIPISWWLAYHTVREMDSVLQTEATKLCDCEELRPAICVAHARGECPQLGPRVGCYSNPTHQASHCLHRSNAKGISSLN